MNQLALAWLLAKDHATTIVLGGNTLDHFRSAYAIADKPLDPDLVAQIDDLSASRVTTEYFNQPIKQGFALNVNG